MLWQGCHWRQPGSEFSKNGKLAILKFSLCIASCRMDVNRKGKPIPVTPPAFDFSCGSDVFALCLNPMRHPMG